MLYKQAIDYLFSLQKFGIKLGLANITQLLSLLGNPHRSLNCIHVAGTNGKGSTCAFLQSIFKHAGYAAGLYTSPHLIDFTERIRINDSCIPRNVTAELTAEIKKICENNALHTVTFFEFTTAMAFYYFKLRHADPVIVETGMGGRYDATNSITPRLSIITSISMEHEKYLGNSIEAIAREKAGIIKPGIPLVCAVSSSAAKKLFTRRCSNAGSPLLMKGRDFKVVHHARGIFSFTGLHTSLKKMHCGLSGDHQLSNAALAIEGSLIMRSRGYRVDDSALRSGIEHVHWPGRLEQLRTSPAVIADGAHNPEGWRMLKKALAGYPKYKKRIFILGAMADKAIDSMLKILTTDAYAIIVCRPKIDRAAGRETIEKFISFSDRKRVFWFENSVQAYNKALSLSKKNDLIIIAGSLFLVGELREMIMHKTPCASGRIAL
ncbi:MAG: bifunctional folylpolyglutamate synthase/dihydrofolate synthase [Deltaproteobacteria bacterium]|nr:bifunctional folylpolyglutamate synthase/dihydrofolate synthase [Deltaproteobacteria bacterium]